MEKGFKTLRKSAIYLIILYIMMVSGQVNAGQKNIMADSHPWKSGKIFGKIFQNKIYDLTNFSVIHGSNMFLTSLSLKGIEPPDHETEVFKNGLRVANYFLNKQYITCTIDEILWKPPENTIKVIDTDTVFLGVVAGSCMVGSTDLAMWIVENGYGIAILPIYKTAEAAAKSNRRGMWQGRNK